MRMAFLPSGSLLIFANEIEHSEKMSNQCYSEQKINCRKKEIVQIFRRFVNYFEG